MKRAGRPSSQAQSNQPQPSTSGGGRNVARKSTAKQSIILPSPQKGSASTSSLVNSPEKARAEEHVEKLAHECAYYMMVADQKKYPIKKNDVVKHVLKDKSRLFGKVLNRANAILKQTFGIRIDEVPDKKENFILTSKHTRLDLSNYQDAELQQRGLLLMVLSTIHLNSGILTEEALWKTLEAAQISEPNKMDPIFGDVKKLVSQEWVKQLYLRREMISNSEPAEYQYLWGYRAMREVDVSSVKLFYENVSGRHDSSLLAQISNNNNSTSSRNGSMDEG